MQTQLTPSGQIQFPMQELEQIESVIQASRQWLATLENRREALTLERVTRPQPVIAKAPIKMIGPGLEYRGAMFVHWNYIDIHIDLLRRLWSEFPDLREAMAQAMGCYAPHAHTSPRRAPSCSRASRQLTSVMVLVTRSRVKGRLRLYATWRSAPLRRRRVDTLNHGCWCAFRANSHDDIQRFAFPHISSRHQLA